jgi:HEAT repeats
MNGAGRFPMVPTSLLTAAVAALGAAWLGLAVWIVGGRLVGGRRRRRSAAVADGLASGRLAARSFRSRRLRLVADGDFGVASARAAAELVRRDSPALLRSARRPGFRRTGALRVLARGGSPAAFAALREARADARPSVTAGVVAIAAEFDTQMADRLLLELLVVGDHPRSRTATELVPRVPRLVDELLALTDHSEPAVRYWALMLLRYADSEPGIAAAAVSASTAEEPLVRGAAARLLGVAGGSWELPVLRALLGDDVFFVRAHAARAVGELGAQALAADVAALLADENWWTRAAAKESLLVLGPAGLEAALAMRGDDDRFARDGASEVVDGFGRDRDVHGRAGMRLVEGFGR